MQKHKHDKGSLAWRLSFLQNSRISALVRCFKSRNAGHCQDINTKNWTAKGNSHKLPPFSESFWRPNQDCCRSGTMSIFGSRRKRRTLVLDVQTCVGNWRASFFKDRIYIIITHFITAQFEKCCQINSRKLPLLIDNSQRESLTDQLPQSIKSWGEFFCDSEEIKIPCNWIECHQNFKHTWISNTFIILNLI